MSWPEPSSFWPAVVQFYRQDQFCDLKIQCGSSSGSDTVGGGGPIQPTYICCHKLVLASVSRLLRRCLASGSTSDRPEDPPAPSDDLDLVHLPEFSHVDVKTIIDTVYESLLDQDQRQIDDSGRPCFDGAAAQLRLLEAADADLVDQLQIDLTLPAPAPALPPANEKSAAVALDSVVVKMETVEKEEETPPEEELPRTEEDEDPLYEHDDDDFRLEEPMDLEEEEEFLPQPKRKRGRPRKDGLDGPTTAKRKKGGPRGRPRKTVLAALDNGDVVVPEPETPMQLMLSSGLGGVLPEVEVDPEPICHYENAKNHVLKESPGLFKALVGLRWQDEALVGRVLAATAPRRAADLSRQFERSCAAFKSVHGLADFDLYLNAKLARGSGEGSVSSNGKLLANSLRSKLSRELAKLSPDELSSRLSDWSTAEYEARTEARRRHPKSLGLHGEATLELTLLSDDSLGDNSDDEALAVLVLDKDDRVRCRLFDADAEEGTDRGKLGDLCVRALVEVWGSNAPAMLESKCTLDKFKTYTRYSLMRSCLETSLNKEPLQKQCQDCGELFVIQTKKDKLAFTTHQQRHKVEKMECDCDLKFTSVNQKKNHILLEHSGDKYTKCKICRYVIKRTDVEDHERKFHGTVICDICGKDFPTQLQYTQHKVGYHKAYQCSQCDFSCIGYKAYYKHTSQHEGPFYCEHCPLDFKEKPLLQDHLKRMHQPDLRQFKCDYCGKTYTKRCVRDAHVNYVHLKKRNIPCRVGGCDVKFLNNSDRNKHERRVHQQVT